MKTAVKIVQILVGLLFIISGLVKANDPVGLSFKMQEFFELWIAGFSAGSFIVGFLKWLHTVSLLLSVAIITLEILAGVALLIGWKKKFILWLLLLLIIFFSFLTGYAYLSGKFTNCGCFGDCLPITPLTSFTKDIVLLLMILFLLYGKRFIYPVFLSRTRVAILTITLLVSLGLQGYVLTYLPIADCLPFKKGNNIAQQMKPPVGSKPDSVAIKFIYEKAGKRYEWDMSELPPDYATYKYIDRIDKVVRKGNADPPIKSFSLLGVSGEDSTMMILNQPLAVLAFTQNFDGEWQQGMKDLAARVKEKGIKLYIASPDLLKGQAAFANADNTNIQFFNSDFTVVRTVARTNPTILFLKQGTIVKKYSAKEIEKATRDLSGQ